MDYGIHMGLLLAPCPCLQMVLSAAESSGQNVMSNLRLQAARPLTCSLSLLLCCLDDAAQGFVGLGFPLAPGRMVPADAVIGRLDNATGVIKVSRRLGTWRLGPEGGGAPGGMTDNIRCVKQVWRDAGTCVLR